MIFGASLRDRWNEAFAKEMKEQETAVAVARQSEQDVMREVDAILKPVAHHMSGHQITAIAEAVRQGEFDIARRVAMDVRRVVMTQANVQAQAAQSPPPMYSDTEKLAARMGWYKEMALPMCINIVRKAEKVHVFGLAGDEPFTLSDDASMFPSDELVTKLRMLNG